MNLKNKELDLNSKGDGIRICEICGEPQGKEIILLGKVHIVPVMCKCKKEESEKNRIRADATEKQTRLQQVFNNSLMTKEFKELTFKNWNHAVGNEKMFSLAMKYVNNFKQMRDKNLGLLIHGEPGNGKTFLSACIANELLTQMIPVVCISSIGLLDRIKRNFSKWGDSGTEQILNCLDNADLVIIDDLGTENNTSWSRAMMYQIIDTRYRKKKPLIITTNLTIDELKKRYDQVYRDNNRESYDKNGRTFDRLVNEMCTPIENTMASIRVKIGIDKTKTLKELLK